jgi:hypothetical protein
VFGKDGDVFLDVGFEVTFGGEGEFAVGSASKLRKEVYGISEREVLIGVIVVGICFL